MMLSWPFTSIVYMILLIKTFPFFLIEKIWSEGLWSSKDWPSNHFLCPPNNFLIRNSFSHTRTAVLVYCHCLSSTVYIVFPCLSISVLHFLLKVSIVRVGLHRSGHQQSWQTATDVRVWLAALLQRMTGSWSRWTSNRWPWFQSSLES